MTHIQEGDSIDKKSERIVESLNYSARNILPRKTRKVTRDIWKDDEEINNILQERSTLDRVSDQYKFLSKRIKKRIRHLRNDKLKAEAEELNKFANKRQVENLFRIFDDNHAFKSVSKNTKCDPGKLKEYFYNHFKSK